MENLNLKNKKKMKGKADVVDGGEFTATSIPLVSLSRLDQRPSCSFHICNKDKNCFCYICGKYEFRKHRREFNSHMRKLFSEAYSQEVDTDNDHYVPNIICNICRVMLQRWSSSQKIEYLKVITPAKWMIPSSKENCYFCMTEISDEMFLEKKMIKYAAVPSVIAAKLVENANNIVKNREYQDRVNNLNQTFSSLIDQDELNREVIQESMEIDQVEYEEMQVNREGFEDQEFEKESENENSDEDFQSTVPKVPELFSQAELNDLVRELGLPKDGSEYLASILKRKNLLDRRTNVTFYRKRDENFRQFFKNEDSIVYSSNIRGLMDALKPNIYKDEEWRLFIDSSKRSLKVVLLHNTNKYAPVPVAYSKTHKEQYESLKLILEKIKYKDHNWLICGDLKLLSILLGQQSGFTKFPCYLCKWDSRDRKEHYKTKVWPIRESMIVGKDNIIAEPLVNRSKILLPPLHIKLGLTKQFVKTLDKEGKCIEYIEKKFPKYSDAKIFAGVFDGPQIRALMKDENFTNTMTMTEKKAWNSFKDVCDNFLGNNKHPDYKKKVCELVSNFQKQNCLMNLKLHFLDSHIDDFPDNLGDYSEEHGERFHQDFKEMENRYQGRWDVNMMADYCWSIHRDKPESSNKKRKRLPLRRSFEDTVHRYHKKKIYLE